MARALMETKIDFDYFLKIANEDFEKAWMRVFDSMVLNKLKALKAAEGTWYKIKYDKDEWGKFEDDIKRRYTSHEFTQLKRYGFSGVSIEKRAKDTDNEQYYNLVYRMYSRNVHLADAHERLGYIINENFDEYEQSRILALLQAAFNCSVNVIYKSNDWLGKPISLPEPKKGTKPNQTKCG